MQATAGEGELIRRCQAGDARAYEPLVRDYEARALRLATGLLGDVDDAHDAVQDAFVRAYENLARFDSERPFGPWFLQILRNRCRDLLRTRRPRFGLEILDGAGAEPAAAHAGAAHADPERQHARRHARELMWRALGRIGEEQREILLLKEFEGLRYSEIAAITGVAEGTVASRLYHARRALRSALDDLGPLDR